MLIRFAIALLTACAAAPLMAQVTAVQAPASQPLAAGAPADVVRDVIAAVRKNYVHPERVDAIVKRLEQSLASGRYSTANQAVLAERMSADLKESSGNDGHMYINYRPAEAAARARGRGAGQGPGRSFFQEQMRSNNHGVTEMRVLPGNVRYINLSEWAWDPAATPRVYDDAMRYLREGDAMIIDIRGNGGGSAEAVNYIVSHFMDPDQKLMTFREGPSAVEETRTQRIAAGKISGKPLFVLTGPASGSASEEFASHIRHFKLGTLVGQTTSGAGNPNSLFPTAHGFVLSVSTGLAIHPVTGAGWEGVGVAPHQTTELAKALDAAHLAALKAALSSASTERRASLQWAIDALAADGGASPGAQQLLAYAGSYEGDRRITEREGRLYWKRGDAPELELIPLGGNRFAIGDRFGTRVEFGGAAGLTMYRPNAAPERIDRTAG